MMDLFLRVMRGCDDHWLGDLIGAFCLFGTGYGLLFLGYGVGL